MRWLALDIGSKRVGVAVCDADERVATPLPATTFGSPAALADSIAALVRELEAGGVIVGVPVTRSGQGRGERRVAAVVEALRRRLAVPVVVMDERGTTQEAERLLVEAGVAPRRRAQLLDSLAAKLILDSFLALPPGKRDSLTHSVVAFPAGEGEDDEPCPTPT